MSEYESKKKKKEKKKKKKEKFCITWFVHRAWWDAANFGEPGEVARFALNVVEAFLDILANSSSDEVNMRFL